MYIYWNDKYFDRKYFILIAINISILFKKKHRLLNDKKKKYERENLHKQMKTSEQDAKDFGIAFAAWKAAN